MKKYLFVTFLILSASFAKAQDGIMFKIKFSPNHTYQISTNISGTFNTDLSGNKELVDKLSAQGITQPLVANVQFGNKTTATTGALSADNSFPITMVKDANPTVNVSINGKQIPIPVPKAAEMKFYGQVSADGKLSLDSLGGKKLDDSAAAPFKKMMNSMMGAINFPEHALKIGESFTQSVPFNLPIGGKGMAMSLKKTYKLISISGDNAFFDIEESIDMQLDLKGVNVSLTGNGIGKMIYSIKDSYPSSSNGDIKMFITVKSDKFNAVATAKMSTSITYQIN
jgi:hypothetical protein